MKKFYITLEEIKLVGMATRTDNESEMNPETAKIGPTILVLHAK